MKTLKYFSLLLFFVHIDLFHARISPLNNQSYLQTSGLHGLRITHFGQTHIYSGVWSHIFHIQFPDILFSDFSKTKITLNCKLDHGPYQDLEYICQRYNHLINITLFATD